MKEISVAVSEYICNSNFDRIKEANSLIEMRAEKLIATVNMEYNISENIFIPDRGEIKHVQEIFELQA